MKKAGREARKIPCARRPWNPTPSASLRAGSFRKVRASVRRPGGDARRSTKLRLETEAPFEFEHATRQPGCRCTEQWVRDWRSTTRVADCCRRASEAEWRQVE